MADGSNSDTLHVSIESPEPPIITQHGSSSVLVSCRLPKCTDTEVKEIEVSYKEASKIHPRSKCFSTPQTETFITNLAVSKTYHFQIRAKNLDDDVVSDWSEITKAKIVEYRNGDPAVPGQPRLWKKEGCHTITLKWNPPELLDGNVDRYEIYVFREGHDTYSLYSDTTYITVDDLMQMCSYKFRVRSERRIGEEVAYSGMSEDSEEIQTEMSIGSYLKQHEDTICEKYQQMPSMSLHKIKCYPCGEIDHANKIRHILVGQGKEIGDPNNARYVLLFGQTGAGKSTIIDLIVNHVYDVAWQDDFRLKAVDMMEDEQTRDKTESQTQWITCYKMRRRKQSMLPFDLVVIDTPGFNSLSKRDNNEVKKQFLTLILENRIPGLHAICFVAHSHTGRLTANEKALSKMISDIFGKEIKESIFIFATCADSSYPMIGFVLKSVGVKFHETFKFNNTPFTLEKQMSRSAEQRKHWIEGKHEIFRFFDQLEGLQLKSLKLPAEIIFSLEKLNKKLKSKEEEADDALHRLLNILSECVHYTKEKQSTPRQRNATICNRCQRTCCDPCYVSWIHKRLCWHIYLFSGICVGCTPECTLEDHETGPFRFEHVPSFKMKVIKDNQIDRNVITENGDLISREGRLLTDLFTEMHDFETQRSKILDCETGHDICDTIDTFLRIKKSESRQDLPLIDRILTKCKNELLKPMKRWWNDLNDLE